MKNRLLSTLGLCKKAGKLLLGFDVVAKAAKEHKLAVILVTEDLSPKSRKEIALAAQKEQVEIQTIPVLMDEIWFAVGKRAGILGITDPGLAVTIKSTAERANEEELTI